MMAQPQPDKTTPQNLVDRIEDLLDRLRCENPDGWAADQRFKAALHEQDAILKVLQSRRMMHELTYWSALAKIAELRLAAARQLAKWAKIGGSHD